VHAATAAAQAAGTISEKHARVVTGTIGRLPHSLDEDTVGSAEQTRPFGVGRAALGLVRPRPRMYPARVRDAGAVMVTCFLLVLVCGLCCRCDHCRGCASADCVTVLCACCEGGRAVQQLDRSACFTA